MSSVKAINKKILVVMLLMTVLAVMYGYNQELSNSYLRALLEWKKLGLTIWGFVIVSFSCHYISNRENSSSYSGIMFEHFGAFADSAFAAITFGLASTTSASILRGVYIQKHFGDQIYFNKFDDVDIYSMLVVCLFLLGYSVYSSGKALISSLYLNTAQKAEPVY